MVLIQCVMPGLRFSSGNEAHEPYAVVAPLYAGKEFGNNELNIVNEVLLYQCLDHLKDACFHQNLKYKPLCCTPSCEMFTFQMQFMSEQPLEFHQKKCLGD